MYLLPLEEVVGGLAPSRSGQDTVVTLDSHQGMLSGGRLP